MKIEKEQLLTIAELSCIAFTDEQLQEQCRRLEDVAEIFKDFEAFDLSEEQPMDRVNTGVVNVLRADEPHSHSADARFNGATVSVPRVIGKERA